MSTTAITITRVPLDKIDPGDNVRELDQEHVKALAGSIELRGLIVPLVVRPEGDRFVLVAGHHRYAACKQLRLEEVEITLREHEGSSADSAAENVVRKALSPLDEARAVQRMLDDGYTLDGAATVLGWSRNLVTARAKILALPPLAQTLMGSGELPVSAVAALTKIVEVSPPLCEATLVPIAEGEISGDQFAHNPGWVIGHCLRAGNTKVFAAYLSGLDSREIAELRLGKASEAAYSEAERLHRQLDRYAYGPPMIRLADVEIDQARAAGVLIEFEHGTPIITDRALLRELAKQAITRTVEELRDAKTAREAERAARTLAGSVELTAERQLESDHRAAMRELATRAHGTNLDLGAALMQRLAVVDPGDMDVARFFAYGLLGPSEPGYLGGRDHAVMAIAATGVRLVFEEQRTTTTPVLKSGQPGKTKVVYGDVEDAQVWIWTFLEGAQNAGELLGRTLMLFAAQHYVNDLVLPRSQRRGSVLPSSRRDAARKSFEKVTKKILPRTHTELRRALDREARNYEKKQRELGERDED